MKVTLRQAQSVRCSTCGAKPGERCELSSGQPRTEPHRDRRLTASELELTPKIRNHSKHWHWRHYPYLCAPVCTRQSAHV